ncbi:diaminopimelate epimerase [Desulforegula conservatrix]|uniref:diaminopimelate epimerase n=1 Tax=Desulforegula conservatrix TaxID=153026 RepID=UPI00040D61DA|nr:diaminopimelate epimerase [Desulforegula conservatrix]
MLIEFSKMHGLGNDFVFIDSRETGIHFSDTELQDLSISICDRHHGIGADGLVVIKRSDSCDIKFIIYNSDGSRARMCGNAIRCLSWYIYEKDTDKKTALRVETDSGIVCPVLIPRENNKKHMIRVDMGKPVFAPDKIPCLSKSPKVIDEVLNTEVEEFRINAVSMGNPHAVIFVEDVNGIDIEKKGKSIENHPFFPQRTNIEFIKIISENEVLMRVWERGAGETLACGTGACAAAVVCIDSNLTANRVSVRLSGGLLDIEWDGKDGNVYMTGPATHVFDGVIKI